MWRFHAFKTLRGLERVLSSAVLVLLSAAAALPGCLASVDEADLARRVAQSNPTWQNYHEDIKDQVGARPVAEWEGSLEEVQAQAGLVTATFRLAGPWAKRDVAIPLLLQEPLGGTHRNDEARRQGDRVTYTFHLPEQDASLPWIELRFPHHTRRVAIPPDGTWKIQG